jgi:hypothetical protein
MPTIVVSPLNVANFPEGGGHLWVYMHYVLGLMEEGCDVYWMQEFRSTGDLEKDARLILSFLKLMKQFGMSRKLILYSRDERTFISGERREYLTMSEPEAESIIRSADLLLNFHYNIDRSLLKRFRRTALVDIDPGLLQFWIAHGQLAVPDHDFYFTTGETVGRTDSLIPDCGLRWIPIRPPVYLGHWPAVFDPKADAFTTVSCWDTDDWIVNGVEEFENTKRVSFLEFSELPRRTKQPIELALYLRTEKDAEERSTLEKIGWKIRNSPEAGGNPNIYRSYIQASRGEFSCAKPCYVRFQTAWVSDRSLCYLASAKPVVVQNTGPSSFLPDGEGMFRFTTLEQAVRAFDAINSDYERHCRTARQIAETWFDARDIAAILLGKTLNAEKPGRGIDLLESLRPVASRGSYLMRGAV